MKKPIFCTLGSSDALVFAKKHLLQWGYPVHEALDEQVTHLLLPVPTPAGCVPPQLPQRTAVMGGRLPELKNRSVDLLLDEHYLAENAAITADCAMALIKERMAVEQASALVIGWGRIGKCLASSLRLQGAAVTVAARRPEQRTLLRKAGFAAISPDRIEAGDYALIVNTAPAHVMDATGSTALCIDLASVQGITGEQVLWARGLPGKMAPAASGALIAKTALRYALSEE